MSGPDSTWMTAAVLFAAFTHACWHALLKSGGGNQIRTIGSVYATVSVVCLVLVPFVALPSPLAFVYIALSVALHCGSYVYIARSYTTAHLSQAFPLYRGLAPLLVAVGAWVFTGENPGLVGSAGLLLAAGGVAWLAFERGVPWRGGHIPLLQLLLSALFVAAYTVVDGLGVRASEEAIGYIVWLFLINGPVTLWVSRRDPAGASSKALPPVRLALASLLALLSHGIVIWAMSVGSMATVAALRETAVIFAAIIGAVVLGDPFGRPRIIAAAVVTAGVVLLHGAA